MRRDVEAGTEFVSVTFFDDLAAVQGFAGDDYEKAVVAEEARRVLVSFDTLVLHYDVAFEIWLQPVSVRWRVRSR